MKYGTDYSKTAINLTNPNEVKNLLLSWDTAEKMVGVKQAALEVTPAWKEYTEAQRLAQNAYNACREAVERAGSYQNITEGHYALMHSRTRVSYDVAKVKEVIPEYAVAVINEAVDSNKISGLVKGKLISPEQLEKIEVRSEVTPAFIIAVIYDRPGEKEVPDAD